MDRVSPSLTKTAFNCPHCGALAKQFWYSTKANSNSKNSPLPTLIDADKRENYYNNTSIDNETKERLKSWIDRMVEGHPFLSDNEENSYSFSVFNLSISECFNCKRISIWIHDKQVYPQRGEAPIPNPDLSPDILTDYWEASTILDLSPRGAAALLRLAIQKLCKELGQSGKDLNQDIGALVDAGLDPLIQKSLDAVRVVGNNAVHPGQIDLRDNKETVENLFNIVNLIAERMISIPKRVEELYSSLPKSSLDQIQKRDS